MIKSINSIITVMIRTVQIMFCMLLVCACGADGEETLSAGNTVDADYLVGFRISLGESNASATRSTPTDGTYDDGRATPFENYISLDDYRVLFFDIQNKYIASFKPETLIPLEGDMTNSKTYQVVGRIDGPLPEEFKVVMLANWQQYPDDMVVGRTTINDVCTDAASQYVYQPLFVPSSESPIPLFGVKLCENMTFKDSEIAFLGTLHLLRAMAKIEVTCTTADWEIDNVMLHGYNTRGWCAPEGVCDESDYVKGSYDKDYTDNIHIVDGASEPDGEIAFNDVGDGRFVIYVPEYRNVTADNAGATAARISVKFKKRADHRYPIDFKYYNNPPEGNAVGDAFDIKRNYYYKFTVSKSDESAEPEISVDLYPYEVIDLDPVFGNDK